MSVIAAGNRSSDRSAETGGRRTVRIDGTRPDGRGDAHDQKERNQRPECEMLARIEIWCDDILRLRAKTAVEDALDHRQHIGRAQDHAHRGQGGPDVMVGSGRLHGAG